MTLARDSGDEKDTMYLGVAGESREGETEIALAVQFGQTEEFFGPFGSKFNHRDGWASTRVLLKGDLQVLELHAQQSVPPVHSEQSE
jgi:hypothetical protein